VTTDQLTSGKWITSSSPNGILAANSYANKNNLHVGSTLTINGTTYTIVGLVNPTLTGSNADLYFPLATLQKMASKSGRVTQILVKTNSASNVDAVDREGVAGRASRHDEVLGGASDRKPRRREEACEQARRRARRDRSRGSFHHRDPADPFIGREAHP
jgi:hypothetical protein